MGVGRGEGIRSRHRHGLVSRRLCAYKSSPSRCDGLGNFSACSVAVFVVSPSDIVGILFAPVDHIKIISSLIHSE